MKKLILLLLFIPLVSFSQDTIPMTKILTQKEAYKKKMMKLKKDYKAYQKDKIKPGNKINNNPIVPIMYSASLSDSFMLCSDLIISFEPMCFPTNVAQA